MPFQAWTPDVYQGAPDPGHRLHGRRHQGRRVRRASCACSTSRSAPTAGRGSRCCGSSRSCRCSSAPPWPSPRATSSGCWPTPRSPTPASSSPASSACRPPTSSPTGEISSLQAVLFYLATYGFATARRLRGRRPGPRQRRRDHGDRPVGGPRQGVARSWRRVFAFFLLAMAGIPLTSGFVGKLAVFSVALAAGAWPVVVAAVLASIIAAFLYIRVIKVMYFDEPVGAGPSVAYPSVLTATTIAVGCRRDPRPRRPAGPGARPGGGCGRIHQVTDSPLALPVVDAALEQRLVGRLARIEELLAEHCQGRTPYVTRAATHLMMAGRQAVPAAAGAARRRDGHAPRGAGGAHRGLRRGAHPRRLALPRRRHGRGGPAPRCRHRQRALGQPRRDPHRRLPLRPVLRAHRRPGARRRTHPGAHVHPPGRGPDPRDREARARRGPARALPRGRGRQDRLAHRDLGALRRDVRRRARPRSSRRSAPTARSSARPSSSPTTSSTSPRSPTPRARPPAPTCARACRRCRC